MKTTWFLSTSAWVVTMWLMAASTGGASAQIVRLAGLSRVGADQPTTDGSPKVTPAGGPSIKVSKTAYVDGQNVCGTIRITNAGGQSAIPTAVVDSLEVHFPLTVSPPALPVGSTPTWFKVAEVPVALPGTIPPRGAATIDYCFSLCLAADAPGANSMRNVVAVTVMNEAGDAKTVTTRSVSFPPPVLDCQACCLPDGSCIDTVPDYCAAGGGLSRGAGTDCATTDCTQACCLPTGACENETLDRCNDSGGEALGLGTDCDSTNTTCSGACCWAVGCTNDVSRDTCERLFDQGVYLGNDTTCETQLSACPTGACCETFDSCIDFGSEQYHVGKARCENSGGTYQGDGTVCADRSCAGACCWAIGCTNNVSEHTCERLFDQGVYLGNDTTCETQLSACPTGACCREGSCIDFESEQYHVGRVSCENSGGTFLGDGTTCASSPAGCRGACCLEVGCSDGISVEECNGFPSGTYLGNDTTCASELGACPTGACCLQGDCLGFETLGYGYSQAFCQSVGALYLGDGTPCTSTSCTEACCFGDTCEELLPENCTALGGDPQGPGTDCGFGPISPCSVIDPG